MHITEEKQWLNLSTLPTVCITSAAMAAKLKKVASKQACWQVITWSRKSCQAMEMDSIHIDTWARMTCWHVSTKVRKGFLHVRYLSTRGRLALRHKTTQSALAREHISTPGTLARSHVFVTHGTQFSRLKNLARFNDNFQWYTNAYTTEL